jgi:sirohydrochlorin cobaltochelatase
MPSAYLLVSHGSKDRRPELSMQQLAALVCHEKPNNIFQGVIDNPVNAACGDSRIISPPKSVNIVGTACLELGVEPLHKQIENFAYRLAKEGFYKFGLDNLGLDNSALNALKILPIFLSPGVHVMEDIPSEVALAQQNLDSNTNIRISLLPYLGTHPGVMQLLAKQMASQVLPTWILLAHGSRRPGGNQPVEYIADSLGAIAAYWSTPPNLQSLVKELVDKGWKEIGIQPYFLFSGGITDKIARTTEELKFQFPGVNLYLNDPLGPSIDLAKIIWDLTEMNCQDTKQVIANPVAYE